LFLSRWFFCPDGRLAVTHSQELPRMLRWRLLLGTVFVALIVVLCWLDASAAVPASWLFPLALVVTVLASGEMLWLMKARGLLPTPAVVYGGNVLILLSNWGPQFFPHLAQSPHTFVIMALTVAVMGAFVAEMIRYESPGGVTERLGGAVLALVYVGVLFSFVVQLRFLGTGAWGIAALGSLVAVTKCCDIGAYAVGRMIGRHKLVPKLSPGKTWEGVAGGLIFACIAAVITFAAFDQGLGEPGISGGESTSRLPRWGVATAGRMVCWSGVFWSRLAQRPLFPL
jgi:phosphatidate cytidylyltransferase